MTDSDEALEVYVLARMSDGVGIIEPSLTIVDDGHASPDAVGTLDGISVYVNPHNRKIGGIKANINVGGREISRSLDTTSQNNSSQQDCCHQLTLEF